MDRGPVDASAVVVERAQNHTPGATAFDIVSLAAMNHRRHHARNDWDVGFEWRRAC